MSKKKISKKPLSRSKVLGPLKVTKKSANILRVEKKLEDRVWPAVAIVKRALSSDNHNHELADAVRSEIIGIFTRINGAATVTKCVICAHADHREYWHGGWLCDGCRDTCDDLQMDHVPA